MWGPAKDSFDSEINALELPPSVPQPSPSVEPALDAEPSVNAENDVNMNDDTEEDDQIMTPADKHNYNTSAMVATLLHQVFTLYVFTVVCVSDDDVIKCCSVSVERLHDARVTNTMGRVTEDVIAPAFLQEVLNSVRNHRQLPLYWYYQALHVDYIFEYDDQLICKVHIPILDDECIHGLLLNDDVRQKTCPVEHLSSIDPSYSIKEIGYNKFVGFTGDNSYIYRCPNAKPQFPFNEPERLQKWISRVSREDKKNRSQWRSKKHNKVCSKHFVETDFYKCLDRPQLRPNAVSSIFPEYPPHKQPKPTWVVRRKSYLESDSDFEDDKGEELIEGDYVIVKVKGKLRDVNYIARVDQLGNEYEGIFLKKTTSKDGSFFFVPYEDDGASFAASDVIRKLPTPNHPSGRQKSDYGSLAFEPAGLWNKWHQGAYTRRGHSAAANERECNLNDESAFRRACKSPSPAVMPSSTASPSKKYLKRLVNNLRVKNTRMKKRLNLQQEQQAVELKLSDIKDYLSKHILGRVLNFILSQVRMSGKKKKCRCWFPHEKSFALSLLPSSVKTYRMMRQLFHLPSEKTLMRRVERLDIYPGFCENFLNLFKIRVDQMPVESKLCSIVFDEVALKCGVTYDAVRDEVEGFEDFGCLGGTKHVASHATVFMVRGLEAYNIMGFYGSTQTNRMIRAPEQKARDQGFPLLILINPIIILHTTIDSST
ncbi:hypothetical protein CAPTEDRAFT_203340 [Capitella teleta]|uniref:THAP-type domain-containing protein n=1 Tax=Capitella teleta TaxID=283909 RepID=R7V9X4_CAPTE|nr:hypothetical protein CAPTEDRAFT_203340 [Capitella teleta]|eukprot:ELU15399.1 hypothetical protein CAPTEDRAFT_203340 [Capitella teleta]